MTRAILVRNTNIERGLAHLDKLVRKIGDNKMPIDITQTRTAVATVPAGDKLFTMKLSRNRFGLKWMAEFKSPWFEDYLKYVTRTLESKIHTKQMPEGPVQYYPMQKIFENNRWMEGIEAKYEIKEWRPGYPLNIAPLSRVGVGNGVIVEPMISAFPANAQEWAQTMALALRLLYNRVHGVQIMKVDVTVE